MVHFKNLLAVYLGVVALGCATPPSDDNLVSYQPHGPGAVFPTIETAAVDALAYGYRTALEDGTEERTRGGTIQRVDGGYTYSPLIEANVLAPMHLTYSLGPRDVAHFRVYPRTRDHRQNYQNERVSRTDRHIVDARDPGHRPLFVLTPRLMVRAYRGESLGTEAVADLGAADWSKTLATTSR